jgi:uncharacterized protein (TIGR02145 family)
LGGDKPAHSGLREIEYFLIFLIVMEKHFNFKFMILVALSGVIMVVTTCKKSKELSLSAPTVNTWWAVNVSQTWATLEGGVTANNQTTIVTFEYDTTTTYGHIIKSIPDTIVVNKVVDVVSNITGLLPGTKYHFRVIAVNSAGTTNGKDTTFTTAGTGGNRIIFNPNLTYGSLTDIDGNAYKTIQIGNQTWMAENLKTTRFNDGTAIPLVKDVVAWAELSSSAYCWYTNDSVSYGAMYNWFTVNTGTLCPAGWHVPSDAEWTTLSTYLGGDTICGNQLKETGITHWQSPNTGATDESGFTALPGGYRGNDGSFTGIRKDDYLWSSSESSLIDATYRALFYDSGNGINGNSDKKDGFNVRCMKDGAR